jgi:hypothetical protein
MSSAPLTHHQIIELVEPFSRQGLHIDLAASDRLQRRLRFRSIEPAGQPAHRETLLARAQRARSLHRPAASMTSTGALVGAWCCAACCPR